MSIRLGTSGANLTIRVIAGPKEKESRDKIINALKCSKAPIYKGDLFLYWEVPRESLPQIYNIWKESDIVVEEKASRIIEDYNLNSTPLDQIMVEEPTVFPANPEYEYRETQMDVCSIDYNKVGLGVVLDVGSGKTLCVLARAANIGFNRLIVFTVLDNFPDWERHFRIMFGDDVKYVIYDGTKKQRAKIDLNVPIILTNYEKAKEIKELELDYDSLILDEGHTVLNPDSKGFKVMASLAKKKDLKSKIICTATPIEESIEPLWGMLHILCPTIAGSRDRFMDKFQKVLWWREIPYTRNGITRTHRTPGKAIVQNKGGLQAILDTMVYRKDTSASFKFEDLTEIVDLDITPKQKLLYDAYVDELESELDAGTFYEENALTKVLRCMQISDGLYNLPEYKDSQESTKLDWAKDLISKVDYKVVFWSRFRQITVILEELFPDKLLAYNGLKSKNFKKLAKFAFQGCRDSAELAEFNRLLNLYPDFPFKEPGTCQFLACTMGGRSGLGMNFQSAHTQVFFNVGESGRSFKQAGGRIRRSDSEWDTIKTIILVTKDTLEPQHAIRTLEKIKRSNSLLNGDDTILDTRLSDIVRCIREK